MTVKRVACVGTGNIAESHATVLKALPGVDLVAAVDPRVQAAASFARRWGISRTFGSIEELIAARVADVAHVLVPPPLHKPVAEKLLQAGIGVFLEKPMAQTSAECDALQKAAAQSGAVLRVNHNFVHHPSHVEARRLIAANAIGPVRHVEMRYNLPLRQLGAGQLGHWMFDNPRNLLLEQAVHPLSQIDDLVGSAREINVLPAPAQDLGGGRSIRRTWLVSLVCERGTAQLYLSLGETYPAWGATIFGDDGVINADYTRTRVSHETSGRYGDFFDDYRNGAAMGRDLKRQSRTNLVNYATSLLKLRPRSDSFILSMAGSIKSFYADWENSRGDLSGEQGRRTVELCERMVALAGLEAAPKAQATAADTGQPYDVLVIGGTGFIGSAVVAQLQKRGKAVGVLSRSVNNLPEQFHAPNVTLIRGDARNAADISRAIGNAKTVINLAHGGGGGSRAEVEANLVGAARTVAECCLASGVQRLIFVSSIAALYLGNPSEKITDATSPDPLPDARADYARAKVLAERAMMEMFCTQKLPVVILRPGVVIGKGTSPFHSGIGFYNHETHCLGWNDGRNPLPLILVDDVATAIVNALDAPAIEGKSYNLVGDVRLNAREYIDHLAKVTRRPLRYHPQSVLKLYAIEMGKSAIKKATGRTDPWPSLRDLKSRGLPAQFDCSEACRVLSWAPVRDREHFLKCGFPADGGS
jgi:predicted dehydrogenase/nucleoside-diphosphate-sugar epimerase